MIWGPQKYQSQSNIFHNDLSTYNNNGWTFKSGNYFLFFKKQNFEKPLEVIGVMIYLDLLIWVFFEDFIEDFWPQVFAWEVQEIALMSRPNQKMRLWNSWKCYETYPWISKFKSFWIILTSRQSRKQSVENHIEISCN